MNFRMNRVFSLAAILVLAAMLLAACGQSEPPQTVTIKLDANPTTGYSWQVIQSEDLFTVESSFSPEKTDEPAAGSGGTETFVLTPKKAGTCEVTFSYVRPWESTGEPDEQMVYTFKVDRHMQVQMLSAIGYSTDFPVETPSPEIG